MPSKSILSPQASRRGAGEFQSLSPISLYDKVPQLALSWGFERCEKFRNIDPKTTEKTLHTKASGLHGY
jgi:hypothetical protein